MAAKATQRLRGRAGVEQRKRRRAKYPLCAECLKEGIVRATDEIDHIIPLDQGGPDTDANCQGLCETHHNIKTASETHYTAYPTWVKPSAIPVTIVCGPPCSGKTTHVRENAEPQDIIIDFDDIVEAQTGERYPSGKDHLGAAIRERNARLGQLSTARHGRAWFIVTAAHPDQRAWWAQLLGGTVMVIDAGEQECLRRNEERRTPWLSDVITAWYRPKPWTAPKGKHGYSADGKPKDPHHPWSR